MLYYGPFNYDHLYVAPGDVTRVRIRGNWSTGFLDYILR